MALAELGLAAIIRPSFTLGGTGRRIAITGEFSDNRRSRRRRLTQRQVLYRGERWLGAERSRDWKVVATRRITDSSSGDMVPSSPQSFGVPSLARSNPRLTYPSPSTSGSC